MSSTATLAVPVNPYRSPSDTRAGAGRPVATSARPPCGRGLVLVPFAGLAGGIAVNFVLVLLLLLAVLPEPGSSGNPAEILLGVLVFTLLCCIATAKAMFATLVPVCISAWLCCGVNRVATATHLLLCLAVLCCVACVGYPVSDGPESYPLSVVLQTCASLGVCVGATGWCLRCRGG